jgi:stage II sporulation protein Q
MKEEEKKRNSSNSKMQRFFRKRWVFPAIYLIAAAIILTGVLWFQNSGNDVGGSKDKSEANTSYKNDQPAVPVSKTAENFVLPALNSSEVVIAKEYYESDATKEKQEAALVYYDNTYRQNRGIDIAAKDGKSFDVVASLSGTVAKVNQDPILGFVVEIEHEKGVVTVYQSLADVKVKAGDAVDQGQVIAKASKSLYDEEVGIHAHFEIRKDGIAVNPLKYVDKPIASLDDVNKDNSSESTSNQENKVQSDDTSGQVDGNSGQLEDAPIKADDTSDQSSTESDTSSESPDASISMANA